MSNRNDMNTKSTPAATQTPSPEANANIFSRVVFAWAQPLFRRAKDRNKVNQGLQQEDLLPLLECDLGSQIGPIFEKAWKDQVDSSTTSATPSTTTLVDGGNNVDETTTAERNTAKLSTAIRAVVGRRFVVAGLVKFVNTCLQFTFPLLLQAILKFIELSQKQDPTENNQDEEQPWYIKYEGYWLSGLLFLAMGAKAMTENYYFHSVYRAGYQTRVAVSVAVYNKALRLTSSERHGTTLGEMVNLMQVDASKIEMFLPQLHVLWDGMLQIVGKLMI